ncbi:hypothetical protein IKF94_00200 [Candidatus Saccharibacteria bacterium]|nr:hypothetical protein [Candidatus Saccharibacteria bacterium]
MDRRSKIFSIILYLLPILFFIVSYFLITTSGEDIFQGAGNLQNGTKISVIEDAKNAFDFNSRVTDVYAWSVIDFYDYQYNFGIDTIFRIIDVALAAIVFYLATYLILNRRPKLIIKDALIFCATFIAFIITPFGYTFYREFSMIHNYVPLALVTLLFAIPYLKLVRKTPPLKHLKLLSLGMLLLGIYFGMAATITPLAFLITVIIYMIINRKKLTRLPLWFFAGLLGTIIGFCICWFAGSGINHYTNEAPYDYIVLSEIFNNVPKLIWHEIYNFSIVIIPLLCNFIICFIFAKYRHNLLTKTHLLSLSRKTTNTIIVFGIFIVVHVLEASLIEAPFRLLVPAYLAGIIVIIKLFIPHINSRSLSILITISTTTILLAHTILLVKYRSQASQILQEIKTSDAKAICVERERTVPTRIPILDLSQANFIVNWWVTQPIYDKDVTFCEL